MPSTRKKSTHEPAPANATPKRKRGQPSKYPTHVKPKLAKIRAATAKGATRSEIAKICGVCPDTIIEHAKQFSDLAEALRGADAEACVLVEAALFQRAIGYKHPAVKFISVSGGTGQGSEVEEHEYTEHYPPDTEAAKFFLANRQPDRWKHKVEVSPEDGKVWPVEILLTRER